MRTLKTALEKQSTKPAIWFYSEKFMFYGYQYKHNMPYNYYLPTFKGFKDIHIIHYLLFSLKEEEINEIQQSSLVLSSKEISKLLKD